MERKTLIAGLKGRSVDVIYTVTTVYHLVESGEPGVTGGILREEDADCVVLETTT